MIICGFPGVGKTNLAMNSNWIDLDSSWFNGDFETYVRVAIHLSGQGKTVMISTHAKVLDLLDSYAHSYVVVVPQKLDKAEYKKRYIERGSNEELVDKIMKNWEDWIGNICSLSSYNKIVIVLPSKSFIRDVAAIIREFKEIRWEV